MARQGEDPPLIRFEGDNSRQSKRYLGCVLTKQFDNLLKALPGL